MSMSKILVADDEVDLEVLIKQRFRKQIRENKYQFIFSLNGNDALQKLQEHPDVDVILSDINMPEMDGLTLLNHLPEISPLVKAVMVSAYGDMDNIRAAMNRGAFDFICKPVNFEDLEVTINKTIKHVNQTRETLRAIKENDILKMYVDDTVLNFMNRKEFETSLMSNESVDASIVFIDICGFTSITESQSPDTVVKLLNKYFDLIVKEIIGQGGHVDKFIGDAVMAVFRGEYHLDRAIEASIAVRESINNIVPELSESGYYPKVSIGINNGEVVSGNIGSVSLRRLDFTVIGDVVNTAQRLQSIARPEQILIPAHAYQVVKESFNLKQVGEFELKNKTKPIMVYEVLN